MKKISKIFCLETIYEIETTIRNNNSTGFLSYSLKFFLKIDLDF